VIGAGSTGDNVCIVSPFVETALTVSSTSAPLQSTRPRTSPRVRMQMPRETMMMMACLRRISMLKKNETRQIYFPSYNSKNIECSSKLCVRCRLFAGGIRYSKKHIRLNLNLMAKLIADSFFQMYISEVNMLCAIAPSL
jgi:hypothetical protein